MCNLAMLLALLYRDVSVSLLVGPLLWSRLTDIATSTVCASLSTRAYLKNNNNKKHIYRHALTVNSSLQGSVRKMFTLCNIAGSGV